MKWTLHPPPEEEFRLEWAPLIRREAERQSSMFYPYTGEEDYLKRVAAMECGLLRMVEVGSVRIIDGEVLTWHPLYAGFTAMDDELNNVYMGLAKGAVRYEFVRRAEMN